MSRSVSRSVVVQAPPARVFDLLADPARHAEVLALLRAHPALERARKATRSVAGQARSALTPLPDTEVKAALVTLVDSATERVG